MRINGIFFLIILFTISCSDERVNGGEEPLDVILNETFLPGTSYYDSKGYVEYKVGNLPIIISVPHGGNLEPNTIPDRDCNECVILKDLATQEIANGIYNAFIERTGCYPHVIINLLHRKKFDANRDIVDAADGNPTVEKAWLEYHQLIDSAKAQIRKNYGKGVFLDIHGHSHANQRIELGYLLNKAELQLSDSMLNTKSFIEESSIRNLVDNNIKGSSHSELLRGQNSFGAILQNKGFPSVPSSSDPFPKDNEAYFNGGYNTIRHGSKNNETKIDGIQVELNRDLRLITAQREIFIDSIVSTTIEYIHFHYNSEFIGNFCN